MYIINQDTDDIVHMQPKYMTAWMKPNKQTQVIKKNAK